MCAGQLERPEISASAIDIITGNKTLSNSSLCLFALSSCNKSRAWKRLIREPLTTANVLVLGYGLWVTVWVMVWIRA